MDAALLLLRVVVGLTVTAHGAQKLFGWFGGPGRDGFAQFVESLGLRRGSLWAWVAGVAEVAGGLLFAVGLLTPLGAAAIIGMTLSAMALVHWPNGFFAERGGVEVPFLLAVGAVAVTLAGPGAFALDPALGLAFAGPVWATGTIVVAAAATLAVLGLRQLQRRGEPTGPKTAGQAPA